MPVIVFNRRIEGLVNPFQDDIGREFLKWDIPYDTPVAEWGLRNDDGYADPAQIKGDRVILCHECSSSLDMAWYLERKGAFPEWSSVLCRTQWAGRGQKGRRWMSPQGNIYAAFRWPETTPPWKNLVSIMAGYLMIRFLAGMNVFLNLKWPNDLLFEGKKVGGILSEEKNGKMMVGLGLNTASNPGVLDSRYGNALQGASLREIIPSGSVVGLWMDFIRHSRLLYEHIVRTVDTSEFLQWVEPLLAFKSIPVRVVDCVRPVRGYISGLTADGGLRLSCGKSEKVVYSGSLVPLTENDE